MAIEVRCIRRNREGGPHEGITHIGGFSGSSKRWWLTLQDAIERIESGKWRFFVSRNGQPVDVVVATTADGRKYIKTAADAGEHPEHLLRLPDAP